MVQININPGLSINLDISTIKAIERHVNLDLSLEEKLDFFIEKLIIATYIEMQPMDVLRKDNTNYKYFDLKFDRQQAEKILKEIGNNEIRITIIEKLFNIYENIV